MYLLGINRRHSVCGDKTNTTLQIIYQIMYEVISSAVKLDFRTVWGFPQIDSAVVGCGAVELDDLNFRRTSFSADEFFGGREGDYIWLAPLTSSSVRARSVTGSLLLGSSHRLVRSCLCSAVLFLRWIESADVRSVVIFKRQLAVVRLHLLFKLDSES